MLPIDIVPLDPVGIKVVQDCNASLVFTAFTEFTVIRLSNSRSTCERPVTIVALVLGGNPGAPGSPEPAIHNVGGQVGSVTASKVAFATSSPNISQPICI